MFEFRRTLRGETNSTRRRIITNWKLRSWYSKNNEDIWFLVGQIIKDNDPSFADVSVRITSTSPIRRCEGDVVTTVSGSQYILKTPHHTTPTSSPDLVAPQFQNLDIDWSQWPAYPSPENE